MFNNTEPELTDLYVNDIYAGSRTLCRDRTNKVSFSTNTKRIDLIYELDVESVTNCDLVVSAKFKANSDFIVPKQREKALSEIKEFFTDFYSKIVTLLKSTDNIPEGTFLLFPSLISESAIMEVSESFLKELQDKGFSFHMK